MLVFYVNFGGGVGGNWGMAPLLMLLPVLLGSGLLTLPFDLVLMLVSGTGQKYWKRCPGESCRVAGALVAGAHAQLHLAKVVRLWASWKHLSWDLL